FAAPSSPVMPLFLVTVRIEDLGHLALGPARPRLAVEQPNVTGGRTLGALGFRAPVLGRRAGPQQLPEASTFRFLLGLGHGLGLRLRLGRFLGLRLGTAREQAHMAPPGAGLRLRI